MTDLQIEMRLSDLVREERRITNEILKLINLAEDRKLYLERGFPSLFAWLVGRYGYSEAAANRRIQAARLLRAVPQVEQKIKTGEVNLTTLAKAQAMIRAQESATGKMRPDQKEKVVQVIERKTILQAEQALMSLLPEASVSVQQDRKTIINETTCRMSANFSEETLQLRARPQLC